MWIWQCFDNILFRLCCMDFCTNANKSVQNHPRFWGIISALLYKILWNLLIHGSPALSRTLTNKSLVCLLHAICHRVSCTKQYLLNKILLDWTGPPGVMFWITYFNTDNDNNYNRCMFLFDCLPMICWNLLKRKFDEWTVMYLWKWKVHIHKFSCYIMLPNCISKYHETAKPDDVW